jgi:hypothetical protein
MQPLFTNPLTDLTTLQLSARQAEVVEWEGRRALRLDGLALLPFRAKNISMEVWAGAEGACFPGLAFRVQDTQNYELVYAQPHTSGGWDALQYDPTFNESNTWQVFHGPAYQKNTQVPLKHWFHFRLDVVENRMSLAVDGQEALRVTPLAHPISEGQIGIWTYLPAYFCDLTLGEPEQVPALGIKPEAPQGSLDYWLLDGQKKLLCEANGSLLLNRWLPMSAQVARLSRSFRLPSAQKVRFQFGFSDQLTLRVDGIECFQGKTGYQNLNTFESRGYVLPGEFSTEVDLPAGEHELSAEVAVNEFFGWGLTLASEEVLEWKK